MKRNLLLVILIFGVTAASALAQSRHQTAQSLGMGSGGTAYVDGYQANFLNPANLMLDIHRSNTTIGFANIGMNAGGSLVNIAVYNKYLTSGQLIAGETRTNMLNDWFGSNPNNTRQLATTLSVAPIGVSHRSSKQAFSMASRVRITEDFSMNKGMAELLTYGLDADKFSTPTPINFNSNMVAFAEISVGYARHLMNLPNLPFAKDIKLFVGVAPKYLYGVYTADLDFNSTLQMTRSDGSSPFTINHDFNYSLQTIGELSRQLRAYEAAFSQDENAKFEDYVDYEGDDLGEAQATGFGVDFGATLQMDVSALPIPLFFNKQKTLRLSMSVTDLGKLSYDQSASNVYADGEFSYSGAQDEDSFNNFFDNLGDSLKNDVYGNFNSEDIDAVTYNLPSMYNFGASLEMGKLLVALDYGVGFNNAGINSTRSVLALGAQYHFFGFLPVRAGTRIGGYSSAAYSAGIGLDFNFLEFTVGASTVGNSENNGSSVGAAWSGIVIRF
ncbi:MAG: hypothetical protein HUJ22_05335 [Gracilimonas sp.]|uniref:DUF5723 family protein n=1 Tax=Gracilimonas sp. TaxID=1974203 RepID=UPI0019A4C20E|nr:DUF5723 family protein [Gracilimonas sp.]MBD3615977.1 hypothetical protein [Gracilimonas sp.]